MMNRTTIILGDSVNRQAWNHTAPDGGTEPLQRSARSVEETAFSPLTRKRCIARVLSPQIENTLLCEARRLGYNVTEIGTPRPGADPKVVALVEARERASMNPDVSLRPVVYQFANKETRGAAPLPPRAFPSLAPWPQRSRSPSGA